LHAHQYDVGVRSRRGRAGSTITYAVNGKQYVAVLPGDGLMTAGLLALTPGVNPPKGQNGVYVFTLPEQGK
jgi:hypothetical protein